MPELRVLWFKTSFIGESRHHLTPTEVPLDLTLSVRPRVNLE